jgi:bifunctional DNA-binding transcriptional regulator/antitoxin component of YhaV-PrlF toxin-antitoxin module
MTAVKIKRYKVKKAGVRGFNITLPQVWVDDVGLKRDDAIDVLRTEDNRLVFVRVPAADMNAPRGEVREVPV